MITYKVFKRSAATFEEFGRARKIKMQTNLSLEEARRVCSAFNDNRTSVQIKAGTKAEFCRD